ncbi:MAG: hypothetical protein OK474_00750 [Thaumarchaeota archaeon]|nr:hypothetical protein [Nitrososphaerota archaeon]
MSGHRRAGLDSRSLAGVAVFGALSVVLTLISQALGLNFPIVPYLQFDLGEVAILLAFFIFGPVPALIAAFIEFATLLVLGVNAAFFGPELKLIAVLSSLLGVWIGVVAVRRMRDPTIKKAVGLGSVLGMAIRAAAMTVPNYLLIVFLYTISGILGYVAGSFKLVGITLTDSNVLVLVLIMTAVFNALQFAFVSIVSYGIVSLPQVQSTRAAGRKPWIASYLQKKDPRVT